MSSGHMMSLADLCNHMQADRAYLQTTSKIHHLTCGERGVGALGWTLHACRMCVRVKHLRVCAGASEVVSHTLLSATTANLLHAFAQSGVSSEALAR